MFPTALYAAGKTNGALACPERASLKDGDALWELSGLGGPCLPGAHRVGYRVPYGCAELSLIPGSWEHPSCEVAFIMSQPCLPLTPPWSVSHLPRIEAGGEGEDLTDERTKERGHFQRRM